MCSQDACGMYMTYRIKNSDLVWWLRTNVDFRKIIEKVSEICDYREENTFWK